MRKSCQTIVMVLLSTILLFSPVKALNIEFKDIDSWKQEALISPNQNDLLPAGNIEIKWNALGNNQIKSYEVYLDNQLNAEVDKEKTSYEIYTTKVAVHTIKIAALLNNNERVMSNERTFYVSKKGLAYENVNNVQDIAASWYYNWGYSSSVNTHLDYVPMIWGHGNEVNKLNSIKNNNYKMVLGYNEPEGSLAGQSNVTVDKAIAQAKNFKNSGLRVGSPAVEHLSDLIKDGSWFDTYMKGIDQDDIDFIAVHEYLYSICNCTDADNTKTEAKKFLNHLNAAYEKYHKSIWITELGVVNHDPYWKHYSYQNEQGKKEVYQFMQYIINGVDGVKGLDDLEFVERYAWFPFDSQSETAGASSLFITETDYKNGATLQSGTLNELGKLYRNLGNPKGYESNHIDIKYATYDIKSPGYNGKNVEPEVTMTYEGKDLVKNKDYKIICTNNTNAGKASIVIEGIGNCIGRIEGTFAITEKDISNFTVSYNKNCVYTGKKVEPEVIIKDQDKILIRNQDYTVSYSNNKELGTAQMKIIGIGNYDGTIRKTFEIIKSPITSIGLNQTNIILYSGQSYQLKATILPEYISDDKTLVWSSNQPQIVSVSQNGLIQAKEVGSAEIVVKTSNGKTALCKVEVKKRVLNVKEKNQVLKKGKTLQLHASVNTNEKIIYKSSHPKVLTVNDQGIVKAIAGGKGTITITCQDVQVTCEITVPYTITYKLNKGVNHKSNPSTYYGKKITLKNPTRKGYIFSGWYSDSKFKKKVKSFSSGDKTLYAKWTKVSVKNAKTPSLTNVKGNKLKISYKATSGAKGYQIQYSINKKFSKATTKTLTKKSATYKVSKGKTYYVRVRAYKLDSTGAKVYGKWSTVKTLKIKK